MMAVERVDYYSDEEYQQALQQEEADEMRYQERKEAESQEAGEGIVQSKWNNDLPF
jgi:hypothetical protein